MSRSTGPGRCRRRRRHGDHGKPVEQFSERGGGPAVSAANRHRQGNRVVLVDRPSAVDQPADHLAADKVVEFMVKHELGLEEPDPRRARRSALTIALSYVAGGLVPLAPYFVVRDVHVALIASAVFTLIALLIFGYVKGRFTTPRPFRSAWQTALVGALAAAAAAAAFAIAKLIG
jgi:VIT1/CCC1 family predicted Fe2+/Mn2+ transporter